MKKKNGIIIYTDLPEPVSLNVTPWNAGMCVSELQTKVFIYLDNKNRCHD